MSRKGKEKGDDASGLWQLVAAGGRNAGHCKLYQQMANRKVTNVCDYVTTVTNCLSSGRMC